RRRHTRFSRDWSSDVCSSDLLSSSSETTGMMPKLSSGKVIACIGTRGGVGVTTIATHLSRALLGGNSRRRVAYIDLDLRGGAARSEEHTSELQSRENLVCRLL